MRHTVVDCDGPFWHRAAWWLRMATGTAGLSIAARARVCAVLTPRVVCGHTTHPVEAASIGVVAPRHTQLSVMSVANVTRGEAAPIFNQQRATAPADYLC